MSASEVVHSNKEVYGGDFNKDLIEQYKIIRNAIIDLQNDRNTNNKFLIGITTTLVGIEGFIARQSLDLETVPIRLTQTPTICRVPLPIVRRDILHVVGVCVNRIGTLETSQYSITITVALSIIPILGAYICFLWIKWNSSYGIAICVRYTLLKKMEEHLPAQPFTIESELRQESSYVPISDIIVHLVFRQ